MTSQKDRSGTGHLRWLDDAIVDEDGKRWDRVRESALYYMTAKEARLFVGRAIRFLRTDGFGSRAQDVEKSAFKALVKQSPDHRVQAFRAADGTKRIIVTVDMSDC